MRIKEIRVYGKLLPVRGGAYRMASASVEHLDSTIVEITADSGLTGWGETCPIGPVYQPHHTLGARAALQVLAPALIGSEVGSVREIHRKMDGALTGHGYAKAALDIAIYDLTGKRFGVPVCALPLGFAFASKFRRQSARGLSWNIFAESRLEASSIKGAPPCLPKKKPWTTCFTRPSRTSTTLNARS